MKTLSERFTELRDETFAEIKKQMQRIGKSIVDESGTGEKGELSFLQFSAVTENEIIGIDREGALILTVEETAFRKNPLTISLYDAWSDCNIGLSDFITLAEELADIV